MAKKEAPGRSSGSLVIGFGLVNVPVKVFSGTEDSKIARKQFSPKGNPIKFKRVDSVTDEEVPYGEIVHKFDLGGEQFVELTDDEIASAVGAENGRAEVAAMLPMSLLATYTQEGLLQVRPDNGKSKSKTGPADKPFALLMKAMESKDVFALVRYALRGKPRIGALTPDGYLRVLAYEDEIREPLPMPEVDLSEDELKMAGMLIEAVRSDERVEIDDEAAEKVAEYVETKAKGLPVEVDEDEAAPETTDLMAALTASLEASKAS